MYLSLSAYLRLKGMGRPYVEVQYGSMILSTAG